MVCWRIASESRHTHLHGVALFCRHPVIVQENKETVIERLAVKNFDARESVEKIIALDNQRKSLQQEAEAKQAQMNIIAKEIGKLRTGNKLKFSTMSIHAVRTTDCISLAEWMVLPANILFPALP